MTSKLTNNKLFQKILSEEIKKLVDVKVNTKQLKLSNQKKKK